MHTNSTAADTLQTIIDSACSKIAPAWSLKNMVAVNPYQGFSDRSFESTSQELAGMGGIQSTMPLSFYTGKIADGFITNSDLTAVLSTKNEHLAIEDFLKNLNNEANEAETPQAATLTAIASLPTGKDWERYLIQRVSAWAAAYFDAGQAQWRASYRHENLFVSWKKESVIDLTPDISGIGDFRKILAEMPDDYLEVLTRCDQHLRQATAAQKELYFQRLLRLVGGWSAYLAHLDWQQRLAQQPAVHLQQWLAILTCFDYCLSKALGTENVHSNWLIEMRTLSNSLKQSPLEQHLASRLILQEAYEKATQRELIAAFKNQTKVNQEHKKEVLAQAIFCIDVRSEVYRRNLEQVNPKIETLGFAGFFGFPVAHHAPGSTEAEAQCPVLLKPAIHVHETLADTKAHEALVSKKNSDRSLKIALKNFRSGAITCFSYVSPMGWTYMKRLLSESFGWTRNNAPKVEKPNSIRLTLTHGADLTKGLTLEEQVTLAENMLKNLSLTEGLAPWILIVGHGSASKNNPQASGLDCGACGGHTGDLNARLAAAVLNDKAIRAELAARHVHIPNETQFVPCLHNTATDEITVLEEPMLSESAEWTEIIESLAKAGHLTRRERALRMDMPATEKADLLIKKRSEDWSQVRPEWGLAGCTAFVIGDRKITRNVNLNGKSFLHSYLWQQDTEGNVLKGIMTAPMIVTSWINLQYYASTVDQEHFGAGNKALHNVTAGLGVIEGASGDLRQGLSWQSVHDGTQFQHDPVKLQVFIQAPEERVNKIISEEPSVRNLCENKWLKLWLLDDTGQVVSGYEKDYKWTLV